MAKYALLIGVSEYGSEFARLNAAVKDVEAMERILKNPDLGEFDHVKKLINKESGAIATEIETFCGELSKEDLLLLYFSGHGIKGDGGALYFGASNTRKNARGTLITSTAVETKSVHNYLLNSSAKRQVVILDCCYSEAFDPNLKPKDDGVFDFQNQLGEEGRVILASSSSTEYSYESKEAELSIYTQCLVDGIEKGEADLDGSGFISALNLHNYTEKKVSEAKLKMTPKIITLKGKGFDIVLSKTQRSKPDGSKAKYRQAAAQHIKSDKIRPASRTYLNTLRIQLGLTVLEAQEIESECMRPYTEILENLHVYEETLREELKHEFPLSEEAKQALASLQNLLGLPDDKVTVISAKVENEFAESLKYSFTQELGNGIQLELVKIPAGEFRMGSPANELERNDNEGPQHLVKVPGFWMGQYAVTQAQWRVVAGLPKIERDLKPDPSYFKGDNLPVETVSWDEAVEFCQRLTEYTKKKYRLPSEAEWEYACRAGTTTPFYFGETITTDLANYRGTDWEYQGKTYSGSYGQGSKGQFRQKSTPAGQFSPNAFGLYDMHGNVWEWCQDVWHETYQDAPADGSAWLKGGDPAYRMVRGGSWYDYPRHCRSAVRLGDAPDLQNAYLGFRVVFGSA